MKSEELNIPKNKSFSHQTYTDSSGYKGIKIFPNPANNNLTIQIDTGYIKPYLVEFYNYLGESIFEKILNEEISNISLEYIEDGLYFVKIISNETVLKTEKLIILK
jgi:hypothetical protein